MSGNLHSPSDEKKKKLRCQQKPQSTLNLKKPLTSNKGKAKGKELG